MKNNSHLGQQSVAKGFAILTVSMIAVKVLSILYVPFLRQILGDEGIGIYNSAYTIFSYVYVLANAGIPVAIAKIVSELVALENYRDALKTFKIARFILIIFGAVVSLIMFFLATPLSISMNSIESTLAIKWLAPGIFITTILCAYKGYFQGIGNMTPTAISQVLEQIFNVIFSLVFAYVFFGFGMQYGVAGGTIGTLVGALVAAACLIFIYEKNKHGELFKRSNGANVKRLSNKSIVKSIFNYSIPITLSVALQNAGMIVDLKIVKARLLNSGLAQAIVDTNWGYLAQYNTLISVPMALIGSLAISILPVISRINAVKDKKNLKYSINSTYRVTLIIAVPCAIGLSILANPVLTLIGYSDAVAPLLCFGSWVLILSAISLVQTSILQGIGKVKLVTIFSVIGLIAKVIANYYLIPKIGVIAAILGNAVNFLIIVLLSQWLINKCLNMNIRIITHCIKPMVSSAIMGIGTLISYALFSKLFGMVLSGYMLNAIASLISVVVSVVLYGLSLVYIGGIRRSDLNALPKKIVRLIPSGIYNKLK